VSTLRGPSQSQTFALVNKKKLFFHQRLLLISDQAAKQQELASQAAEAMKTMCRQTQG